MAKSYYAILGITSRASQADVKTAYRRLAKEFHPDRYEGADRPFLDVQEAYSVLGDSGRRREYDAKLSRVRPFAPTGCRPEPGPEPLTRQDWSAPGPERVRFGAGARAPEPLVPRDAPVDIGEVSPIRSFQTFTPSFDEIFDWLWDNFAGLSRSKSGPVRNLTLEVPLTHAQCARGGHARVMVPARATCPVCRGYGGVGPHECARCAGEGATAGEVPVSIAFPSGISEGHAVVIPLDRYGIHNLYVTVLFRPSNG